MSKLLNTAADLTLLAAAVTVLLIALMMLLRLL